MKAELATGGRRRPKRRGSWLTPRQAIEAGDYAAVTRLAGEALAIAKGVRG